jgi:hypothetical protein
MIVVKPAVENEGVVLSAFTSPTGSAPSKVTLLSSRDLRAEVVSGVGFSTTGGGVVNEMSWDKPEAVKGSTPTRDRITHIDRIISFFIN